MKSILIKAMKEGVIILTNQKRTASVVLRMTDSEKETLQKQAENKHITLSNYLRLLIFENQK